MRNISYNDIHEVKQVRNATEMSSHDFNFGVINFIFDGNELQHRTAKERLMITLKGARRLREVSLRRCALEDDGL